MQETDNHKLNQFEDGDVNWEHSTDMDTIERRLVVRDSEASRTDYTPHNGAIFIAQDTGAVYDGNGSSWSLASRQFDGLSANNLLDDLDANGNRIIGLAGIEGAFADDLDAHFTDSSAHHERYGDLEAQNAVNGADIDIGGTATDTQNDLEDHMAGVAAHHPRYTNNEARDAIHGIDVEFNTVTTDGAIIVGSDIYGTNGNLELAGPNTRLLFTDEIIIRENGTSANSFSVQNNVVDVSESNGFVLPRRSSRPSGTEAGRMIYRTDKD